MRSRRIALAVAASACAVAALLPSGTVLASARPTTHARTHEALGIRPTLHGAHAARVSYYRTNNIVYHQGPIITGPINVYYIWYGNWSTLNPNANSIITKFGQNVGGSPYFNINTSYYNGANVHVTNSVTLKGSTTDNYSQGTSLSDAAVQTIVQSAISSGRLPLDTNGLYFVLTSSDVAETSGFLTQYCGWHTYGTINGANIKYSFVGDPSQNPAACEAQTASSPNGDPAADGMVSVMAHELEEAVTDPNLNAWYDRTGAENGDKCAWTFGTTSTASNGSAYNVTLGGSQFLIQRNWSASKQTCLMSG